LSSYRFCRTDDIGLLVDALNRCWGPYVPDDPPATPATFKRSIRDLQVWCSSCMVAFSGSDPIAVLIGAKRPSGTLIHTIAVHPDHRRQGHGRHLLESLGSKLAILGPPRMVAEVPDTLVPACALFGACGYVEEEVLTDYIFEPPDARKALPSHLMIPVSVDDLVANGLLGHADHSTSLGMTLSESKAHPPGCWERSIETLTARKDDIRGLAVASDEQLEAHLLYTESGEIVALGSSVDDGGARLTELVSQVQAPGAGTFRFAKVHPAEISQDLLGTLGFRPAGRYRLYAATARS
jgi:GNAT superfamily N-acetyltransferase